MVRQQPAGRLQCVGGDGRALRVGPECARRGRVAGEGAGHLRRVARADAQRRRGQCAEGGGSRRDLDQPGVAADHGLAQAEEENGELLAQVAGQGHEDRRRAGLVDGRPGQAQHEIGGKPVAQLGVDRVGADDALGELGPGVGGLVGQPGPTDQRHRVGAAGVLGRAEPVRGGGQGLAPADRDQLAPLADAGLHQSAVLEATRLARLAQELAAAGPQADDLGRGRRDHVDSFVGQLARQGAVVDLVAVDRLEGEAALVAQPAVVDRLGVDAEQPGEAVLRGLHGHPAADRAGGAGGFDLIEVPRPGGETVRSGGQRADRADLHGVAAEVGREGLGGEGGHLDRLTPPGEVDLRLAGHVRGEARAAGALDAAFAVEQHEVRDGDGLLEVALLLDEARLTGAVGQRLVLQRALAALVAHRAVERVVGQQELEHAVLGLLHLLRGGVDDHALAGLDEAGRLQRGAPRAIHLDQAHAAHADGLHARVVAEARDVGARRARPPQ